MAKSGASPIAYVVGAAIALTVFGVIGYLYTRPVEMPPPAPAAVPAGPVDPVRIAAAADAAPDDPAAWARLCAVTARNYWRDSSPADCDKAVELQPDAVQPRLDRAFMHMKVGRAADATAGFEAVLAKEPGNPKALFGRGLMRSQGAEAAAGAEDRKRALAADPNVVLALEEAYDFKVPWDIRR
jgi:hypothetical protein